MYIHTHIVILAFPLRTQEMEFRVYIKYLKIISRGWKTLTMFGGTFFDDVKRSKRLGYPMTECYNRTFQRLDQYCRMLQVNSAAIVCVGGSFNSICPVYIYLMSIVFIICVQDWEKGQFGSSGPF